MNWNLIIKIPSFGLIIKILQLWMGTHPDGPANIRSKNIPLSNYIADGIKPMQVI